MPIKNQVQLITYPDSLGGDLKSLHDLLVKHFTDLFPGGVHILPPFPSSGDRGFAPRTYFEIEPRFGDWGSIRRIGGRFDILLDLMVNHISRRSPYFQDFQQKGARSPYAGLFLTLEKVWPGGHPPQEDVEKIFLRRPEHPFTEITIAETGERKRLWATFGARGRPEQIDLDVHSPAARRLFGEILSFMRRQGVKILRLDAVGYVIKKPGTNCFFVEPDIYDFLNWFQAEAAKVGIELLPEVHAHPSIQASLAERGFWVYDFVLPGLVLHTLYNRSSRKLKDYLTSCPQRHFTMLDCHDGIPVLPDLEGILTTAEMQRVVDVCVQRGANVSRLFSARQNHRPASSPEFDAHQINCTYYSALDGDDQAYLAARAVQFFAPGVPQVYYDGLLAGENDRAAVARSGEPRAINRRDYPAAEVEQDLQKPVVRRLLELIRFRNTCRAFDGEFTVLESGDEELRLSWRNGGRYALLQVDLENYHCMIEHRDEAGEVREYVP